MIKIVSRSLMMLSVVLGCNESIKDIPEKPASQLPVVQNPSPEPRSPEESIKEMHLPEGFRVELVASEPMIQEPVAIAWDANGSLYVAQMRTYMQDIDATDEDLPLSQIVKLDDTDGDGKMDKRTVFIDSLVLPRMILPLDDKLLVQETYTANIHAYRDTDGDGVADEKTHVYHNDYIDKRNLEHQNSGMIWNLDNWIYTSIRLRYKWENNQLKVDSLEDVPSGQWGLGNDDYGRLFLSSAGGETAAKDFQQMPAYGELNLRDLQYEDNFHEPYPIIATPDIEGGKRRLKPDSTLNHFTGTCGQTIYRGDRLPAYMKGDLFICEPVGRLIRRAKVLSKNGIRSVKNAYDKAEFIASTDMNFRPVNMTTGPDGCLYIVDMYRGIIQEGNWTRPNSYIRPQIQRFGLDKNVGRGRIYRIVHEDIEPSKEKPQLLKASSEELVNYLSHPNGWWRDNAQKLLILRNDASIVPALKDLAAGKSGFLKPKPTVLGRIHALWTLEGMKALDKDQLIRLLKDEEPPIRRMAIWVGEDFIRNNDQSFITAITALSSDKEVDVRTQLAQSLRYANAEQAAPVLQALTKDEDVNRSMVYQAAQITLGHLTKSLAVPVNTENLKEEEKVMVIKGAENYKSLCSSCHGSDGKGLQLGGSAMVAPPLSGSPRVNGDPGRLIRIVLSGLKGPVDGKEYPSIMPAQLNSDDQWLAEVLSYVRTNLGNNASTIKTEDIKKVRDVVGRRWDPWTLEELDAAMKK